MDGKLISFTIMFILFIKDGFSWEDYGMETINYQKMKRTPIKRKSKKTLAAREGREEKNKEMLLFFSRIWYSITSEEQKCQSCGKKLNNPPRNYYFDHLIEKSKRPNLALERDNIFLCCLTCHSLKTDGHPTEAHQAAIEKAKERFGIS